MTHHKSLDRENTAILQHIQEGMTVYDSDSNRIGSVEAVYFGAASDKGLVNEEVPATTSAYEEPANDSLVKDLVDVFDPRDEVPNELAERLRYSGYIRIDGGWFGTDRYIVPDQISSVSDEGVYLSVNRNNLVEE